ncbi:MAG: hypothetical protein BWX80_03290 [Candidatus Hydrogenedentes bacterium ADurb.Bin101]|jgi:tetratricopeptide (TPR) repeat protein|nr:MAG: hypothetical protein BWX80_03290 [Candidatus Hydrogenedentes bacterium ADurb.Bin101]HOC68008.1 hypothetical protein [Candidatus Hydrogenedentota bacterium]
MNTAFAANGSTTAPPENSLRVLFTAGLFVVAMAAFMLHVMLIYAPLQGKDLQRYFQNDVFSRPATSLDGEEPPPVAAMPVYVHSFLGKVFGGPSVLRVASLFLHVAASTLVFYLLLFWLKRRETILVPLLGGLLMAITPAGAAAMTQSDGWAMVLATVLALGGAVCFLSGTGTTSPGDLVKVFVSAWFAAAAAAAYPALVIVSVLYVALDLSRARGGHILSSCVDWTSYGILLASGILVFFLLYRNPGSVSFQAPFVWYLVSPVIILMVCRFVDVVPMGLAKRVLVCLLALSLIAGAAVAFMQSLRYADPVWQLEEQISSNEGAPFRRQLALHYYYTAEQQKNGDEKRARIGEALSLWPLSEGMAESLPWERLLWGKALLQVNDRGNAVAMIAPLLNQTPLSPAGCLAARLMATALDEKEKAPETAALLDFASRQGNLSEEEKLRYARSLFLLGDMNGAAGVFASLPEYPEDGPDGNVQRQALAAVDTAGKFQESYRKQIMENPQSISGYVALAESCVASGNLLRAFYWLELVLRRAPDTEGAWELLGTIFALQRQQDYFIRQWGAMKTAAPEAWVRLARRTAHGGAWDAAFEYVKYPGITAGVSAEEYMAVFAVETKDFDRAEQWLTRAVEAHPLSYGPRLFKADLAIAGNAPNDARRYLDEARLLQAPESEIEKRAARLRQGRDAAKPSSRPQMPVRSYIQ